MIRAILAVVAVVALLGGAVIGPAVAGSGAALLIIATGRQLALELMAE